MEKVCIIGGGPAGIVLVKHFSEHNCRKPIKIFLAEKNDYNNSTPPYSSSHDFLLLNVAAGKMGWDQRHENDFYHWLKNKGHDYTENDFVPRNLFGQYISEIEKSLLDLKKENFSAEKVKGEVVDINKNGNLFSVQFRTGEKIECNHVVLALGNFPPAPPASQSTDFLRSPNYMNDPWSSDLFAGLDSRKTVLLIGSGLTTVDCLLMLINRGHKGKIKVLSHHGYLPLPHTEKKYFPEGLTEELKLADSLVKIFSVLKYHIRKAQKNNLPWQSVIDTFRPLVQQKWLSFSDKEKEIFKRHLRHLWGVARHRMPQSQAEKIYTLLNKGQLKIIAGRIMNIEVEQNGFEISYNDREEKQFQKLKADYIVNCTGPESNIEKIDSLLVKNLFRKKMILKGKLSLGINADHTGKIMTSDNEIVPGFYTIGSSLRGVLWETTAIPDIRVQAEKIATMICGE